MGLLGFIGGTLWDSSLGLWVNPAYSAGRLLNEATGGSGGALSTGGALFDSDAYPPATYSNTVLAVSAYDPGSNVADGNFGSWQVPVFNPYTPKAAAESLPWWVWALGGVAAFLALRR